MSKKLTTEEFVEKAKQIHGDKYDYSESQYITSHNKINIICSKHGLFSQTPNSHLSGIGCRLCGLESRTKLRTHTTESFIQKAKQVHGDKYDYSKVEYENDKIKICIICSKHGEFWQTPHNHIIGYGCPGCKKENLRNLKADSLEGFVQKAKQIHGDKYDYSKVEYKNNSTKICIICPKHGEFWQTPNDHLSGKGCSKCHSSKGEEKIRRFLDDNNIEYVYNRTCLDFLKPLKPDFYLPDYNLVIEYDGEQHFRPVNIFGGAKEFERRKQLDESKNILCKENGVNILRIKYTEFLNIENILRDKLILEEK